MSRRRQAAGAIVASPVLVGAVTVLVAIVAVFIAYSANSGLPFVPTYDLKVELPSGAKLVKGNEVRVGGFRVGVVEKIGATRRVTGTTGEDEETVAVIDLKLDKTVEPLPMDTSFTVRPRSALGLKYVEVMPGKSTKNFATGSTVQLGNGGVDAEPPDGARGRAVDLRLPDARGIAGGPGGLRLRPGRPRPVDQRGHPASSIRCCASSTR